MVKLSVTYWSVCLQEDTLFTKFWSFKNHGECKREKLADCVCVPNESWDSRNHIL